ncbi:MULTISPECIES: flagellar hook-basal body complex protein FliE [unclassified Neptuniibacter]|uniref:flagellar hook-basal body complex protein FliE n=1 Tax=unclassified Neptuniibacter TaxID=2630693 RepID=UPI0026E43E06|nr:MULTISPECIES: flagellar hook-basal body complex protein FliE [unclassified Neptuniibacter]MDO6514539.1 flagellar hook-basal body complex protein FliE [Neptuniibacter sp. 2_MG-2023]MDO6594751.1 flagellar hook-basal body complex protein FliE [Neptuniibacter sp. 1_MG-2023]
MVERADINSVLMQMRTIKAQVQATSSDVAHIAPEGLKENGVVGRTSFGDILKNAVDGVHDTQVNAKKLAVAYEQGDSSIDLPQVMIAAEKASISFQAMTQVRNRLVSAYEDIMNMPI